MYPFAGVLPHAAILDLGIYVRVLPDEASGGFGGLSCDSKLLLQDFRAMSVQCGALGFRVYFRV